MIRANGTIAERIVEKVADATGSAALEQPSLYDAVDPDALDTLVEGMSDGEISFVYAGYEVTVDSDETVTLDEQPLGYPTAEAATSD